MSGMILYCKASISRVKKSATIEKRSFKQDAQAQEGAPLLSSQSVKASFNRETWIEAMDLPAE